MLYNAITCYKNIVKCNAYPVKYLLRWDLMNLAQSLVCWMGRGRPRANAAAWLLYNNVPNIVKMWLNKSQLWSSKWTQFKKNQTKNEKLHGPHQSGKHQSINFNLVTFSCIEIEINSNSYKHTYKLFIL